MLSSYCMDQFTCQVFWVQSLKKNQNFYQLPEEISNIEIVTCAQVYKYSAVHNKLPIKQYTFFTSCKDNTRKLFRVHEEDLKISQVYSPRKRLFFPWYISPQTHHGPWSHPTSPWKWRSYNRHTLHNRKCFIETCNTNHNLRHLLHISHPSN